LGEKRVTPRGGVYFKKKGNQFFSGPWRGKRENEEFKKRGGKTLGKAERENVEKRGIVGEKFI